ncbi:MAG: hypothetical protein EPO53_33830 [Variovorax sp.]|nr:MAG: hypothetical protein EPO53_33830 [Variovorax sp.]
MLPLPSSVATSPSVPAEAFAAAATGGALSVGVGVSGSEGPDGPEGPPVAGGATGGRKAKPAEPPPPPPPHAHNIATKAAPTAYLNLWIISAGPPVPCLERTEPACWMRLCGSVSRWRGR